MEKFRVRGWLSSPAAHASVMFVVLLLPAARTLLHLAAYAVHSAATSSSTLLTVGGVWCEFTKLAESACCTWYRVPLLLLL